MGYEANFKAIKLGGRSDLLLLLTSTTGEQAWISNRGASIEELVLKAPDGNLVRVVYGHHDVVAGGPRQTDPLVYNENAHTASSQSRLENLMAGGVPITILPGRLFEGEIHFLDPKGTYKVHKVPISHPQFNSLLHLGNGKNSDFEFEGISEVKYNEPQTADRSNITATLTQEKVGGLLYEDGFPRGISSTVKYTLQNGVFIRDTTITNNSGIYLICPASDHGSFMPGSGNASDLTVLMKTRGELELASGTKVATGRLVSTPSIFDDGKIVQIQGPMEGMYLLDDSVVEIMNKNQGVGLQLEADTKTRVVYVWVPGKSQFLSVQPYNGQPTAALSLPAFPPVKGMHDIFKQTIERMIAPGDSITYRQIFRAINSHSPLH